MDFGERALRIRKGRISVHSTVSVVKKSDLSTVYTPGVAAPCLAIAEDPATAYIHTAKQNLVAVITDGSAVLGLGNLGGLASMPVMEGKCVLFKEFAGVDAIPLCLSTQDPEEIIRTVRAVAPTFGGINLEDIKAPECFYITESLQDLGIPVFHDDQDGTAIVVLAALRNAAHVVKKNFGGLSVVVVGAGAAGVATVRLLLVAGIKDIVLVDSRGVVQCTQKNEKEQIACKINPDQISGSLSIAMIGRDVFIGVSRGGIVTKEMVASMAADAIVFSLANPEPEILPKEAFAAGAVVVGTGRSDFPNQINNALVFPGLFRGLLDARVAQVTVEMKLAVAKIIADCVRHPSTKNILPDIFDKDVPHKIAETIKKMG